MPMRLRRLFLISGLCASFVAFATERAALSISLAGPKHLVSITKYADMSGVTWSGSNSTFYVVRDGGSISSNGCYLHSMTVRLDSKGTCLKRPKMGRGILLEGAQDAEGIARDPLCGTIWISDEADASIREYTLTGQRTGRAVEVPSIFAANMRGNLSLESLTISPDGKTMWTANEEALSVDGPAANPLRGTVIRLVKFTREDSWSEWSLAGMWAYECDCVGDKTPVNSGVSDLCALPDGSLLVLERECSYSTLGRTRIYRPDLDRATDIRSFPSLVNAVYLPARKGAPLLELCDGEQFGKGILQACVACYEGLCLGPRNPDGSYNLMLISDGGAYVSKHVLFVSASVQTMPYIRALTLHGLPGANPLAPTKDYATEREENRGDWRLGAAGFGRGNSGLYGAEVGLARNVWQSESGAYNLWLGMSGAYCPRQKAMDYGEASIWAAPERYLTDDWTLGARVGAAFNWLNAKVDATSSETDFTAHGLLGIQSTYMLNDSVGIFTCFDWRLGDDAEFSTRDIDLTGYLWSLGIFFNF